MDLKEITKDRIALTLEGRIAVQTKHFDWLIEQAGLVEDFDKLDDEYQKDIATAEAAKRSYKKQRDSLKDENARLREALKYAKEMMDVGENGKAFDELEKALESEPK